MSVSVYVINLDRRPDRWEVVSKDLFRLGVAFERIAAIDARDIALEDEYLGRLIDNSKGKLISLGARACTLSHIKVMAKFLQTNHKVALILEDDVELASDLPSLLENLDWFPIHIC